MTSATVVAAGVICAIFWLIAYAGIINRGFRDRTYGMPIAALAANLSWEAAYGFFIDPFADQIHDASIAWFLLDLLIFWQAFQYAPAEFADSNVRQHIRMVLVVAVTIAYPIVYFGFFEFNDPAGEYTGFGVNFMMSILFVLMLIRRNSPRGQSLYIAVTKFLGTLFAWIATALTVTTSVKKQWPDSLNSFLIDSITHTKYPLTPMINCLYIITFLTDILYTVMLYRLLRASGIKPWRHF